MKDYYAEFLQTKNSVNTLDNEVSKVSKGRDLTQKQAFDTFDTNSSSVNQKNFVSEIKLHERLSSMIVLGVSFEVSADDFQIIDAENLSQKDVDFLSVNKIPILCTLQQALLVKHLFSQKPELRQTFVSKVEERGADLEAVCEITGKWFSRLLDTISR